MTPDIVFSFANLIVMPMWVLMMILPNWKVTRFLIDYKIIPVLLSIVYAIYILQAMLIGGTMDFGSLKSVMALFTEENAVLAGWVHYLAFDLLVGMWLLDQNKTTQINRWLMIPILLGTFMFGPIGFLLYIIIKTLKNTKS
ncbi:MAG: ABA4-like family protein [Saprospiraceae bacterium]|nr:ABA4-like family protein [Saprospiraceae bacterium]